jgi:hypothetical protein
VNPVPAIFSQLPGLHAFLDAELAASVSPVTLIPVLVDAVVKLITAVANAFQLAVTVAVWLLLTVPAVAVKVPLLALVAIVMLPGTVSTPVVLDKVTVAVLNAALFSVTVQVEVWPVPNVLGEQLTEDNCTGAVRLNDAVSEVLLAAAVIVAV